MTKLLRSRHVPLLPPREKVLQEEINEFSADVEEGGAVLRKFRERDGWSVSQLAEKVGFDPHTIETMEKGEYPIPLPTAKHFGDIFETDYRNFLT